MSNPRRSQLNRLAALAALAGAVLAPQPGLAQDKELNLFAWSEYVPQTVIDGFQKETGIQVNYEMYASNEEMISKLLADPGTYDLIQPSEYAIEALAREGLLAELDLSKIPNIKNLDPKFKGLEFDPDQKYSVPWMAGTVGITVNSEKVKEPVKGYKDVFGGKYKNNIVALDDSRELISWALTTQGLDINEVTPETLAAITPLLKEWIPQVKVWDSDSPKTAMLNGETDIGIVWSGEGALLYQEDPKFVYVLPEEGAHQFIDNLAIPKAAKNKEAAHQFINYILKPEVSKLISDEFPYTNPNLEARKLLSEEQRANPASYPPGDPKLVRFRDIGKMASEVDRVVTDLRNQ